MNYKEGYKYLEEVVKENNIKHYEITEDIYKYKNGLTLIIYQDEKHEIEKDFLCINLDNLEISYN